MACTRAVRPFARVVLRTQSRTMSTSVRFNAEGSTGSGSSRPGGQVSGDAFTKREKANEDLYVREQEKQKLKELREKIQKQQEHLNELQQHVERLGGEKK